MDKLEYDDMEIEVVVFDEDDVVATSCTGGVSCDRVQDICSHL